ncbi:MAG: sensor domain-containing diguanylate cyclase [Clostridiales bacterium]|nr:sensor domain-containing diguanylate cyclase [Clostridiales bacterium]
MKNQKDNKKIFITVTLTAIVLLLLIFVAFLVIYKSSYTTEKSSTALAISFLAVSEITIVLLACFWGANQARTGRKLKQANEKMFAILENMPSLVYLRTKDGNIKYTFLSDALLKLFGCNDAQFKDRYIKPYYSIFKDDKERVIKEMEEQEKRLASHNLIYRIVDYSGKVIWVHDKGVVIKDSKNPEKIWHYTTLIDISEIHQAQEDSKVNEERYKMILESSRFVVFDWNIKLDSITFSDMWVTLFGNNTTYENFFSQIGSSQELNEDDKSVLSIFVKQFMHGQIESSRIKCRIINHEGKLVWCEISGKLICDDYGSPSRVIGLIHDIDREKREKDKLKFKAQRDYLTKLYNKEMTQALIKSVLENSTSQSRHVMFAIDIDDFKTINDTQGHLFGDEVLRAVSQRLLAIFRSSDIVGRIGGDEFVAFLQDLTEGYSAVKKAEQLKSIFAKPFKIGDKEYKVSGSIGISLYPQDATGYYELFKKADDALYRCKNNGKNDFAFFNDKINPDLPIAPIHKKAIKAKPLDE